MIQKDKPRSRIGYNIHAQRVTDRDRLLTHLTMLHPVALLVLDGKGLGREIKQVLPDTQVIIREYGDKGDDTLHLQMSPEQFLKARAHLSEGGLYPLYTTNEPGFDANVINWHVQVMELAAAQRIPLVVGNFAVGLPRPEEWPLARRMLELLDQHRDLFVLGLHEYGGGVMTSGLVGGAPNGMAADGTGPHHPDYILPENWPAKAAGLTQFHCGRFNFMRLYCESVGIRPPRVILTEHGMDDLGDIKFWTSRLKVRPPYLNIRGWKTLTDQWLDWYHDARGWSPERAYFEQLRWADRAIYQGSIVEAQCVFSWGHSSGRWEQFDVADAIETQSLLEVYAALAVPAPQPEPPPVVVTPAPVPEPQPEPEQPAPVDPEPHERVLTIKIKERTAAEADAIAAYLQAKMAAEYAWIEMQRVLQFAAADEVIGKAVLMAAQEMEKEFVGA